MKRLAFLMIFALLFTFFGCVESPAQPPAQNADASEAPAETGLPTEEPTGEALALALLPDWTADETADGWVTYRNVTPEQLREYTDAREAQGFTLIENEEGKWAKILYRDDAWIEIADNTESYAECAVRVTVSRHEGGMSREEALSAVSDEVAANDRTWAYSCETPESVTALLEITPEGLFEATGMQLFHALFDVPPTAGAADPVFSTVTFIASRGKAKALLNLGSVVSADIDGDGDTEAVVMGYGPTSGLFSLIFDVFGVKDGELESEALAGYVLEHGMSSLTVHDGKPYFVWEKSIIVPGRENEATYDEPVEFALSVEYGEVMIDDPADLLGRELMAHFDW